MRTVWAVLAAALLAAGSPADAKSVHKEFSEAWSQRDDAYAEEFTGLLEEANAAVSAYRAAVVENQPPERQAALFRTAMDKAHAASAARGRGMLLIEFREFMADKPSAARTEVWTQEIAAKLQRDEAALDRLQKNIEAMPEGTSDDEFAGAMQNWIEAHGNFQGEVGEILLIDANLRSYFAGRGEEKARSRSALAGILGGLAAGLQQQQNGFAPAPPLPVTTRCNTYFSGTVCTTN
ncbi:hypothetical protein J3454_07360 [Erythrobacter sp. NFXS35]|uniref:hypothetical protein n=1 Tax=Erythrobacter sp. NFXS35 TaxID=2818436 RepID=UPI0032DF52D7